MSYHCIKKEEYDKLNVNSTLYRKVFGKVIKVRQEKETRNVVSEEQCRFKADRSCVDHMFVVQQLIEKSMAWENLKRYTVFINLEKHMIRYQGISCGRYLGI